MINNKVMKKLILILLFLYGNILFAQNTELFCVTNNPKKSELEFEFKSQSCTNSSQYWHNNSLYVPSINQDVIYLKANFIFLTKPDGTGNFEENNSEHQQVIQDLINLMNYRLANLINPTNSNCSTESTFLSDTKIQIIVNKIWKVDPAWDFLVTGFSPGNSIFSSPLYPPNSNYYYSYFENDQTIPEGVNVVFSNNGDIYQELVINQNYNGSYPFQTWAASQFPTTINLSSGSRQFYPDAFNRYVWFKERVTVEQNLPWSIVREWYIGTYGNNFFPHEFGHSLWLFHSQSCSDNVMYAGWPSTNTYLKPVAEIGKMYRAASITNMRNFFTDNSFTNSDIIVNSNENWDLDFRLYSNVIIDNSSELDLTCNLILPPQSRINIVNNSVFKINGAQISSANQTNWEGIKIQDTSSLEILPGTVIENDYFYAYTDNTLNKSSIKKNVNIKNSLTNFNTENNKSSFKNIIYPNPSSDFINIKLTQNFKEYQIKIIDINGKVIVSKKIVDDTKLNIQNLKKGIYYVLINNQSQIFVKE